MEKYIPIINRFQDQSLRSDFKFIDSLNEEEINLWTSYGVLNAWYKDTVLEVHILK